MMVLIDRKFNEEQLLLETFFPKMLTYWVRNLQKTNNFFPFHIYYNVIDNSLSAYSHCCQIFYFMACIVGDYSPVHTCDLECDSRVIRDGDIIVLRLDCDSEFEPHLKFLANRVCFDNLRASSVAFWRFFDHINKPSLLRQSSNIFGCVPRIFG